MTLFFHCGTCGLVEYNINCYHLGHNITCTFYLKNDNIESNTTSEEDNDQEDSTFYLLNFDDFDSNS